MKNNLELPRQHFFKDKDGRIAIWQWPNLPLYGWIVCTALSLLTQGHLKTGFDALSTAFLFLWAYLEVTQGISYFRRLLGLIVLTMIIVGFFR